MKVFLSAVLAITAAMAGLLVYNDIFVKRSFGPSAMLGVFLLGVFFIAVLVTLRLLDTPRREVVVNLWMALLSVTVSFLVLDLIVGFFLIQPLSPQLVPDPYLHHKLVPNSFSRFQQRDFTYVQRVNNVGLRGADVVIEKPSNVYRIVMQGDSFTMGKGVEDQETFSMLVGQWVSGAAKACNASRSVEVLNAGVDSYAPVLELIQLKRELHALKPDMVVLNLDVSDLVQESAYRRQAVRGPDGDIVAVPLDRRQVSLPDMVREWTEAHLFFTRALLFYVNELFGYRDLAVRDVVNHANAQTAAHTLADDAENRDEQWRSIFESIQGIKAYTDQNGMKFLLTVYPWGHQVSDTEWIPGRYTFMPEGAVPSDRSAELVKSFASRHDIDVVDLFPVFRAHKDEGEELYFKHDPHWTAAGHRVMAKGIEDHLHKRYMGEWCN